ncbi:MAG: hypothetical protein V7L25_16370 [Nostoc sp.]
MPKPLTPLIALAPAIPILLGAIATNVESGWLETDASGNAAVDIY